MREVRVVLSAFKPNLRETPWELARAARRFAVPKGEFANDEVPRLGGANRGTRACRTPSRVETKLLQQYREHV